MIFGRFLAPCGVIPLETYRGGGEKGPTPRTQQDRAHVGGVQAGGRTGPSFVSHPPIPQPAPNSAPTRGGSDLLNPYGNRRAACRLRRTP